jgi:alanine-synthesizing transaminase
MQYAVAAALTQDRSHQISFRRELRLRAELTTERLNRIAGMSCVAPRGAFYAMPKMTLPPGKTDVDYVLGLLRATGILVVYGSGFGTDAADGFFRVVFLAPPAELSAIYDEMASYTLA